MRSRRAVKGGVGEIDVFGIHFLLAQPQALAKALEVDDLPLPQEADDVVHVGIVAETQDVIVCDAGLLFRGKVLGEVGDHVAGGLHASRAPGEAGSGGGVDAGGVVYKVGGEGGVIAHLLVAQVPGELMDQGGYHLHVAQLLCAYIVAKIAHLKNAVNTGFLHYTPHIRYTQVTDWDKLLIGCLRMFIMRLFFTDFGKVCSLASQSHHLLTGFCYNFIVHTEVMHRW